MKIRPIALIIFTLTACSPRLIPVPDPTQIASLTPSPVQVQPTYIPTQGDIPKMPQNNPTPSFELDKLIEMSKMDLSQRLSIPVSEIKLVSAQDVVWSDSSLGCPNPSVMYLQVLTPGYLIRLEALGQEFEFHTDKNGQIIQCDNPSPPLPGIYQDQ